jgi:hypothetical protein
MKNPGTEKKKARPAKAGPQAKQAKKPVTTAFHAEGEEGEHFVGIGNLRVMLFNDDGSWFAQGLEIDYAAQGSSVDDVQKRFEAGLCATLDSHLKMYGTIDGVLQIAPPEVWAELFTHAPLKRWYSQLSFHKLPFSGVEFYEKIAA